MPPLVPGSDQVRRIDAALAEWRQGDTTLDARWFVHAGDPSRPLTSVAAEAAGEGLQVLTSEVEGAVLMTQTCDIVRSCIERPFVEVSPLVEVPADRLHEIERARRPGYAFIPMLAARHLVADLDRVMTVEKSIVASWSRTPGWSSDAEGRAFAQALARKRARFAFPDDFTVLVRKMLARLTDKHDRNTEEGRALRALREIRVRASPSWDAPYGVQLMFWCVRNDEDTTFEGKTWAQLLEGWLRLVPDGGRFTSIEGQVVSLERLSAAEYVHSDPLDLDHLSLRE